MLAAEKITSKKTRYAVLVSRTQHYRFEVSAASPEAACKNLWNKLRYDNNPALPDKAHPVTSVWADPKEKESEWLITGAELDSNNTDTIRHSWNGMKIVRGKLAQQVITYLRDHGFPI